MKHRLMAEVFHCTPEEINAMPHDEVAVHWTIYESLLRKQNAAASPS